MWSALRDRRLKGYKIRRQYPVGPFIVDFACIEYRLIIELDGSQHADSATDARRSAWLEEQGWTIIRFWNNEILSNTSGAVEVILEILQAG